MPLQLKWGYVDALKSDSTVGQIYDRMARVVDVMCKQRVTALGSFIDVDDVIEDKAMIAARKVREEFAGAIEMRFANQTLKGVLTPNAYHWFKVGADFVDIIGALPARDEENGGAELHLDVVMDTARSTGKQQVHVHADQNDLASERETDLVVAKTREYGLEGKVTVVHGVSIAAQPIEYRKRLYKAMHEAGIAVISCPWAWIDRKSSELLVPTHNSITPVHEMVPAGLVVAAGTDNIADVYKPFTNGDMYREFLLMQDACRYRDIKELVRIFTVNGRKVLGLDPVNVHSNGHIGLAPGQLVAV